MDLSRHGLLEHLASVTAAKGRETTTIEALTERFETDDETIRDHLDALAACDLVRTRPDGRVRITITGEEFLALETDGILVVESGE